MDTTSAQQLEHSELSEVNQRGVTPFRKSGGKDSCYNVMQCVAEGHDIVALANLKPKHKDELDSYMYQSVGHHAIDLYAEAMGLPLYRRDIVGASRCVDKDYILTDDDEVEDLYQLLNTVKESVQIEAVSVGAILSNYQRVRVEHVCSRLGLTPLAYLWRRDQADLLDEMIQCGVEAIIIKVAAMGLKPHKHLGKTLGEMQEYLLEKNAEFDLNVCGEGGEYETFTLDCPLFNRKIVIDESELVMHSADPITPVGYLNLREAHLEDKHVDEQLAFSDRLRDLPMKCSASLLQELFPDGDYNCDELCQDGSYRSSFSQHSQTQQNSGMVANHAPNIHLSGNEIWISGLTAVHSPDCDTQAAVTSTMDRLVSLLADCGPSWDTSSLVLIHLYVKNMQQFASINSVYKTYFGINPAARVCVEADLPDNVVMQLDCYGNCCCEDRDTMHVQGLSHWAPANIGPYSQCVRVKDRLYIAGQIGMVPANLSLINGGVRPQSRLSLRHVDRVLAAMVPGCSMDNIISCMCYITDISFVGVAREELGVSRTGGPGLHPVYVVVPCLPKGALVEWQVVARQQIPQHCNDHTVTSCSDTMECVAHCVCEADEESGGRGEILSLVVSVFVRETADMAKETADDTVKMLLKGIHDSTVKPGLDTESLPLLRIFYLSSKFSHDDLYSALSVQDEVLVFSLVPVLGFESGNQLLVACS